TQPKVAIFLDLETTGLYANAPGADILEIGMLAVSVPPFREIDSFQSLVVEHDRLADPLKGCDDFVRKMHAEDGLLADLQRSIEASRRTPPAPLPRYLNVQQKRSEERRVGKECRALSGSHVANKQNSKTELPCTT